MAKTRKPKTTPASFRGVPFLVEKPTNHARRARVAILVASAFALFGAGVSLGREIWDDGCRVERAFAGPAGARLEMLECADGRREVRFSAPPGWVPPSPLPPSPGALERLERRS